MQKFKQKNESNTRPRLGTAKKEEMLAVVMRNQEAYETVEERLTVKVIRRFSEPLSVVWAEVRAFHKKHTALPDRAQLIADLHTRTTADEGLLTK